MKNSKGLKKGILIAVLCVLVFGLALFIFIPALDSGMVGVMVPVSALFTIAIGRILYKRGVL